MVRLLLRFLLTALCAALLLFPLQVSAAENSFIDEIQQRGFLKVGLPPYNTPPAYYLDPGSEDLQGYDVDLATGLAEKLGL